MFFNCRLPHLLATLAALVFAAAAPAHAGKRDKAERIVAQSTQTLNYFATDSAFEAMWGLADDAKAIVVIPNSVRAGFILGGAAGNAVMLAKNDDGSWTHPVFMTVGSVSFGFQAGGEASEIVLLVMTNRGKEQLLSTSVKLGADLSIAAGPVGAGGKAQTTDVLAFSRSRGLYGGISVEGAVLKVRNRFNEAYYNADVTPADIIFRERASNPGSAPLRQAAYSLARRESVTALTPVGPTLGGVTPLSEEPAGEASDGRYDDDEAWGAPVKRDD
ncbi:MAG: lipid-binding SYLF domain-containing protein [Pseudomonadota bacterium]